MKCVAIGRGYIAMIHPVGVNRMMRSRRHDGTLDHGPRIVVNHVQFF